MLLAPSCLKPASRAPRALLAPQPSHIDHPDRIFVGGLPYHLTEEQCRELLGSFGAIKAFDLVKDRDTGLGKG